MKQSLGLLEVSGLALAINCADAMAKAASITLLGLEKTNGSGWTVIKIAGDVASVQSAIITGASFAEAHDGLVAQKVIARPADGIIPDVMQPQANVPLLPEAAHAPVTATDDVSWVTCNLCLDPACPRQKGEPRSLCIHSGQRGE
ncbi:MAG: microcompartment protein [Proteobacteria bacterium]|nr:microcompartment protein [Pseudomonadota bacterium]